MDTYEFTLLFSLPDKVVGRDEQIDLLFEAGLDDVVVGIGAEGRLSLECVRDGESAVHVVLECIKAAEVAIDGIKLVNMSPNLIGVSEIAAMFEMTRQNIAKHFKSNSANPPPSPVYSGDKLLWHTIDALEWLKDFKGFSVSQSVLGVARVSKLVNGYICHVGSTSGIEGLVSGPPKSGALEIAVSDSDAQLYYGFESNSLAFSVTMEGGATGSARVNFVEESKVITLSCPPNSTIAFGADDLEVAS